MENKLFKLLVDAPTGFQELTNVEQSGGYFDPTRVLWDERQDGVFPTEMIPEVGGLVRSGTKLIIDSAKKSAWLAKQSADAAKAIERRARQMRIKSAKPDAASFSLPDVKALLKDLVDEVNDII